ncbi:class I SAM-dependent methyltransferase [uncultured Aquimarina sp.]|uniref:class I SAM-dependent methyltransferase n=1 Tax=uncultured Aquimarina sp. TaxID=575652 RepID=UPI0026057BCF|nr:class I SAM-dependent methyltransferase [uncultured Aquimarina sp.]
MKNEFKQNYKNEIIEGYKDRKQINHIENELINTYLVNKNLKVLEAGTGAGVISFYIESKGFDSITAFDIIPDLIDRAKEKALKTKSKVNFIIADASALNELQDNHFGYVLYPQQILSMVSKKFLSEALSEAFRVGTKDSLYVFSFMDWQSRWYNPILSFMLNVLRLIRGEKWSSYYIPELTMNGKINTKFFHADQHSIFWGKETNILSLLEKHGFKSQRIVKQKKKFSLHGDGIFFVCKKI